MTDEFIHHALSLLDVVAEPDPAFTSDLRRRFLDTAGAPTIADGVTIHRRGNRTRTVRSVVDGGWLPELAGHRRVLVWSSVAVAVVAIAVSVWLAWAHAAPRQAPVIDSPPVIEAPSPTPSAGPVAVELEPALATDQPCTRTLSPDSVPAPVPFRAEDLTSMVLTREDLGAAIGAFDDDLYRNGFNHNVELPEIEVHPDMQAHATEASVEERCPEFDELGRILGFTRGWQSSGAPHRSVYTSVHLFWDAQGAADWSDRWVDEARWGVGTPDGPSRFEATPAEELGPGAWRLEHEGAEGIRSWVVVQRGPVVGWVVDLHPATTPTIDVDAAARILSDRIDAVTAAAGARPADGLDLARLMSVPVPLADWDDRYAGLDWNGVWGGCTDLDEWALIGDEAAVERARRLGMVNLCTGMYGPDGAPEGRYVHVWTRISVFPDETSADAYLDGASGRPAGVQPFEVTEMDGVDEAYGLVSTPGDGDELWGTRVDFRRGRYVLGVGLNEDDPRDARAELVAVARRLDQRLTHLLAGSAP